MKELKMKYCLGDVSGNGYLTFYYVEGEGYRACDIVVVEFEIHRKHLKLRPLSLRTVKEPKYLDYCKWAARAWVKENKDVL